MTYSFTMPAAGSAMKVPAATPETTRYTTRADMQDCIPWHGQRTGCLFYVNRHKLASVIVLSSFHALRIADKTMDTGYIQKNKRTYKEQLLFIYMDYVRVLYARVHHAFYATAAFFPFFT